MKNKNYYDWLEINKNASPEVIEKAYKALVKKYHPDLQEGGNKAEAEEIIKHINEAYDVLSDPIKKADYDSNLQDDTISKEEYDKLKQELNNVRSQTGQPQSTEQQLSQEEIEYMRQQEELRRQQEEMQYRQQIENAKQKAYHDAYIQDLRNRGYKIRYKKSFKDYIRIAVTIVVVILVLFIIWKIPVTHNWLVNLYNSNEIIKFVVDIFANLIDAIFSIFK